MKVKLKEIGEQVLRMYVRKQFEVVVGDRVLTATVDLTYKGGILVSGLTEIQDIEGVDESMNDDELCEAIENEIKEIY